MRISAAFYGLLGLGVFACGGSDVPPPDVSLATLLATQGTADAALQQDRLEDARIEYERLVEMVPDEASGYLGLGLVALKDGSLASAEQYLAEALARATPEDRSSVLLAQAAVSEEAGDLGGAADQLDGLLTADPDHLRGLWARARIAGTQRGEGYGTDERIALLQRLVAAAPGNLASRVELIGVFVDAEDLDGARAGLEEMRQISADLDEHAGARLRSLEAAMLDGDPVVARSLFEEFREAFEVAVPYQAGLDQLRSPAGALVGVPQLDFSFLTSLRTREPDAVLEALVFSDASALSGLDSLTANASRLPEPSMAIGDYDGDGDEDVLWAADGLGRRLRIDLGRFVEEDPPIEIDELGWGPAGWADLDDDRRLDLWIAGRRPLLAWSRGSGGFEVVQIDVSTATSAANDVVFADLDQDGDLDVLEVHPGANRLFRNNGDGTFAELASEFGLAGGIGPATRAVAFADLDNDRDLEVVFAEAGAGVRVFDNRRGGDYVEQVSAVEGSFDAQAVALADLTGDGRIDVVTAGAEGLHRLFGLETSLDGAIAFDGQPTVPLNGLQPRDLAVLDFDNDGRLDIAIGGSSSTGSGLRLYRNEGDGDLIPANQHLVGAPQGVHSVQTLDYNEDGDTDLVVLTEDGRVHLLRNDGGNANHYFKLELVGLGDGSRKNNRFGIGARVEVRAGDLHQVRTVDRPHSVFGLGNRLKADVVRVYWPNGVPQDLYFPGTDQDLIEQQTLKGSCPMLYAWNGTEFEFVGDVMWRSALGMPLGILGGGEFTFAPSYPSQEYRRLRPGVLQPLDGEYVFQVTEELWETIYFDGVNLVAVDHPDTLQVYVDEGFKPPAPVDLELWRVGERLRPVSAVDGEGRDQRNALSERDAHYVNTLRPGRFQGIAEPHQLILDLGSRAREEDVTLFLTGWVFPTDASINVAMAQSTEVSPQFPVLEVMGPDGEWQVALPDVPFPAGKDKTVVLDLRGIFPTADRHVRISTNLMVYWDEAFFTTGPPHPAPDETVVTSVAPLHADLHYRGFSREFRLGGRYGPHWFDYQQVSIEPRWHDLRGNYTRYGEVTELVREGDDRYAIQNAGDEVTLRFDEGAFPDLAPGWVRTFLVYTDGWVKDGDLNTAKGDRVEPLPSRLLNEYPPALGSEAVSEGVRETESLRTRRVDPGG